MKDYYFTREFVAIKSKSYVHDKDGNRVALITGYPSFTNKKVIQTMEGEAKFITRNKFWRLWARKGLVLDTNKKVVARLRRKVITLDDHYDIECEYGKIMIVGNILGFDYHINMNGKDVGHVSRKLLTMDSLVLSLDDDCDLYFFITLVVALDNIFNKRMDDHDID